jgi:hypothetical protein
MVLSMRAGRNDIDWFRLYNTAVRTDSYSTDGPATAEVSDGQIATFTVNFNAGFEATVSHGSFSKETGVWTQPWCEG